MSKTLKLFLEGLLVEHPLQMLNHPRSYNSFAVKKEQHHIQLKDRMYSHDNMHWLGGGADAEVGEKKSQKHNFEDPHHVYKVFHTLDDPKNDSTFKYLTHAMKSSNPYMPRVHSIKSYFHPQVPGGVARATHIVKMEKLHPLSILRHEDHAHQREIIKNRMFHQEYGHEFPNSGLRIHDFEYETRRGLFNNIRKKVKDPNLLGVLHHIHKISKENGSHVDMHGANVMLRQTQHGFHPVISDPLIE